MKMSDEMFEGKDYPTQWALNPSTYQKMNNDQVDWAALAQQWIKMKETAVPPAPPPPTIVESLPSTLSNDGGGEAPMDMDTKDDDIPPAPPAPNISGTDSWNQWNQWGGHWNQTAVGTTGPNWEWNNISGGSDGKALGIPSVPNNAIIPPPAPTISSSNSGFPNHCAQAAVPPTAPPYGYNTMPLNHSQFNNQVPPSNFWNNEQQQHSTISGTPIPVQSSSFIKNVRQNSNRIPLVAAPTSAIPTTDITSSRNRDVRDRTPEDDISNALDTVKRRQLPAWIREGLEKMEREKQKAVERERQEILRKQELEARKKIEDQARAVLNPARSKFDSDSEKDATEQEYDDNKEVSNSKEDKQHQKDSSEQNSPDLMRPRKTRFRDATSPVTHSRASTFSKKEKSPDTSISFTKSSIQQSKEEILQNLMLKVRRSLTEILLEVTNDEIGSVCKEVWKRFCNKASTGNSLVHTSHSAAPVAQITRKLGLGIYGDSNSESDEDHISQNEHSQQRSPRENDSDEELKETLRRRQQAFRKIEAEIETRLAQEEEEEEEEQDGEEEEDGVKMKEKGIEEGDKKEEEDLVRDESTKERSRSRGIENSSKKDNYMGNTSCTETVDNEKDTVYGNERKTSEIRSSVSSRSLSACGRATSTSKLAATDVDKSSSSESASQCNSLKRTRRYSNSKNKNTKSYSSRKKDRSSSRSRSRSASSSVDNAAGSGKKNSSGSRSSKKKEKMNSRKSSEKQHKKSRSRSSSRSESRFRSESRSSSHSRSSSRSRRRRSRNRLRSRSKTRTRTRSRSRSRSGSRSGSRSRSRSRKRSRSSFTGVVAGTGRKRDTRSRSLERARRSRSNSRSSRSYYYYHRSHYRSERDGKKSTHRYQD